MRDTSYTDNNTCPLCGDPITNYARFCRYCSRDFSNWLYRVYGYWVKTKPRNRQGVGEAEGKGKLVQAAILEILESEPATVRELAQRLDMTRDGIRHHLTPLRNQNAIRNIGTEYRAIWTLTESDECDIL